MYNDIPIFILKDSLFIRPSESLQNKLRDLFRTISLTNSTDSKNFVVIDPNVTNLYQVSKLFQFFFNSRVNLKNVSVLIDLVKTSFNEFNCNILDIYSQNN